MNRYENLKKLYSEIELLESAGLHKAASVLHKKFVKEAQAKSARDLMTEINMLAQNPGPDFENLVNLVNRNLSSSPAYSQDEIEAIKRTIDKAEKQRQNIGTFSTSIQPQNPTLSSFNTAVPAVRPYKGNMNLAELPTRSIQPMDDPLFPPATTSTQPSGTAQIPSNGDTANEMQAQNSMPAEAPIYQQAINQIANLLKTRTPMNRTIAQSIYEDTITKFKDQKRKEAFGRQYQRLVSTYFPQTRPVK